eukprot:602382-Amorphochlora_amoeboformis.AAC.2
MLASKHYALACFACFACFACSHVLHVSHVSPLDWVDNALRFYLIGREVGKHVVERVILPVGLGLTANGVRLRVVELERPVIDSSAYTS